METFSSSCPPTVKKVEAVRAAFARHHQTCNGAAVGSGPIVCSVTGVALEDTCVELRGMYKVHNSSSRGGVDEGEEDETSVQPIVPGSACAPVFEPPVVVHADLFHFFSMLWYCCKMEHIVRSLARYVCFC